MSNKQMTIKPKDIQRIIASTNAQTASIEILQLFTQLQAERLYSEEIENLWNKYRNYTNNEDAWSFKEWLVEQFKNK